MSDIEQELKTIVSLLSMRFPIAELAKTTDYSKGTISNYLSGKQAASGKFLTKVKEVFEDDFSGFEFKRRLIDSIEHYLDINKMTIAIFSENIGWKIDDSFTLEQIKFYDSDSIQELVRKISFTIPDFPRFVNNQKRADIKGISLKKLTKLERTVFLKKKNLSEEDMLLFVKIVRKHRENLLQYSLFQKLVRSLAYTLEIEEEIDDFINNNQKAS